MRFLFELFYIWDFPYIIEQPCLRFKLTDCIATLKSLIFGFVWRICSIGDMTSLLPMQVIPLES